MNEKPRTSRSLLASGPPLDSFFRSPPNTAEARAQHPLHPSPKLAVPTILEPLHRALFHQPVVVDPLPQAPRVILIVHGGKVGGQLRVDQRFQTLRRSVKDRGLVEA